MMGQLPGGQERLFYSFNIDHHVPSDHLLRYFDQCVDDSVAYYERAARLDPLSATIGFSLGWLYMAQRRFDAAVTQLEKASELDPSLIDARLHLARTRFFQGQTPTAIADLEDIVRLSGRKAMHLAFLGHAYAAVGSRPEALRIIEELNVRRRGMYVSPLSFAIIYIGLGQIDDAFHWLELARDEADPWTTENNFDLIFDPVRGDPRWRKLRREMQFDEFTQHPAGEARRGV